MGMIFHDTEPMTLPPPPSPSPAPRIPRRQSDDLPGPAFCWTLLVAVLLVSSGAVAVILKWGP